MNKKLTTKQWNTIVLAAMSGDEHAFEEICRQKTTHIMFICNNILHNWQDAEDVTQEVLTIIHDKISTLKTPESFIVWLNTISYNTSMTMRRKQMKEQYNTSLADYENVFHESALDALPVELLETKESRQLVMQAIKNLPANYRMAIIFFYFDGLKAKEIAEIMGTNEKAIENYLFRGRTALKSALSGSSASQKSLGMSTFLLSVFEKTDLPIAAERSAQLLHSMGISSVSSFSGTSAVSFWKVLGGIVLSGSIVTASVLWGIGNRTVPPGLPGPVQGAPVSHSTQEVASASSQVEFAAEDTPPYSQQPASQEESPINSALLPETRNPQGASIMGRIYLSIPDVPAESSPWSVAGVAVHLIPVDAAGESARTTKTMEGKNAGWFMFEHLPPGQYKIKIDLPEYLQPAAHEEATLQNGYLSYHGNTVFTLADTSALNHSLPVVQKGNIQGNITTAQQSLKNQLGGIIAQLYNAEGNLLMATTTREDGSFNFAAPPITSNGWYTIKFFVQENSEITLLTKQIQVEAAPGKIIQANSVEAVDNTPPALGIVFNNGNTGPITDRANAFAVTVTELSEVHIQWAVYSDTTLLATGSGTGPGNALHNLPSGSYLLVVSAADLAGNKSSFDFILELS